MSSDRTIDLVERGVQFHQTLGTHYRHLKQQAQDERTRMALEFLEQHEAEMERSLRCYKHDVPTLMGERWFKYSPNEALEKMIGETAAGADLTIDELSRLAVEYQECMIRFYKQFKETAVPEELEDAMASLQEMEEEAQKKITRALQEQV